MQSGLSPLSICARETPSATQTQTPHDAHRSFLEGNQGRERSETGTHSRN
jgi:hypothetical protein